MANNSKPMIKLEENPKGVPVLSYNVPEPTSYTGQNFLELDFVEKGKIPQDYFKAECFESKTEDISSLRDEDIEIVNNKVENSLTGNITNSAFANAKMTTGTLMFKKDDKKLKIVSENKLSNTLKNIETKDVAKNLKNGLKLNIYKNMYGELSSNFIPAKPVIRPRLVLVETYRLSTYLGSYGAGRTLKTFSLLPGEKTKISVKTYHKTESSSKEASSILDSFTKESSEDFERSVSSENSSKQNESESFEYHAEAEASASWGWGSAKVSGGVKGGSNSSREEFAKNTENATSKHANKASAKRDVQINTSSEVKEKSGEETEIVREIENINVSRTLNFVFRQMNQEFITLLHLTDIRIAFFNGEGFSKKEFTLPELDQLLDEFIIEDKHEFVKKSILNQLLYIKDYKDNQPKGLDENGNDTNKNFIQEKELLDINDQPVSKYHQFTKDLYSKYSDQTGREIIVNGIIVSAKKNVMRTDGVIVDAILGQGDALDDYSERLQKQSVEELILANKFNHNKAMLIDTSNEFFNSLTNSEKIELIKALFNKDETCLEKIIKKEDE